MLVRLRSRSALRELATLAVIVSMAACGGGGGDTGPDRTVTQVTLNPLTPSVIAGQSVTLTAQTRNAAGDLVAGQTVAWSTSDAGVAAVSGGVVTTLKAGSATITASSGSASASTTVTVLAPVAQVTVTPSPAEVVVGQTVKLTATLADASGAPVTGRTVTWTSSSDAAATVAADGTVTGKVVGAVLITATVEGKTGTTTVNVRPAPVATVTVTPNPLTLAFGATGSFAATLKDAGGTELGGRTVTWTSADESIATVTNGQVTTKRPGQTTITATSEGKTGNATLIVTGESVASVTVTPSPVTVEAGTTTQLTATPRDASNNTLNGRLVSWSTSDASKATVSSTGVVTGVAVGTVTITATSEGKTGTATVNVADTKAPELLGLAFSPPNATVNVAAGPATITVTAHLRDGSGIDRFDFTAFSPTGTPAPLKCSSSTPDTGSVTDGFFRCSITIPQGAPAGTWNLLIGAADKSPTAPTLILTSQSLANNGITPSTITVTP